MNSKDKLILRKIASYCAQIRETHQYFNDNMTLFFDEQKGFCLSQLCRNADPSNR